MVSIGACSSQSVPGPPGIDSVGTGYCTGIIWATSDYGAGTRFEFMPVWDGLGSSTVHTLWCCRGLRLAEYSHSSLLTHFHFRRQKDAPSGASYRKNQPRLGLEETREREREREIERERLIQEENRRSHQIHLPCLCHFAATPAACFTAQGLSLMSALCRGGRGH